MSIMPAMTGGRVIASDRRERGNLISSVGQLVG